VSPDRLEEVIPLTEPARVYRDAADRRGAELTDLERRFLRVEIGRVVAFLVGSIVGLLYRDLPIPEPVAIIIAVSSLSVFLGLVVYHRRLRRTIRRARAAEALARVGLYRLARDWGALDEALEAVGYDDPLLRTEAGADVAHPYLVDLDVFGPASVRALLGPTLTPTGVETLRGWLSHPSSVGDIQKRQAAVRSLVGDIGGREQLTIEALLLDHVDREEWAKFQRWLGDPALLIPAWSIHVARFAPPVTVGLFVFDVAGGALSSWTWIIPLAFQTALAWSWGEALEGYFSRVSSRSPGLRRHHALFAAWEAYVATDPSVRALQGRLVGESGLPASHEIRSLERWLDAADSRASMLHIIVAAGLLWDVHVAWGLERWRRRAGSRATEWFGALGELEALTAMATLAHDHPDWCWPEVTEGAPAFEAEGLGHPLLPESVLKSSDVRLEPCGRFLLVTGSNMSGKSTLLRSVGLAAVLAQAGSVVCARRVTMTALRTFTSMRINDSLTGGVSLFMAELLRLKSLVDSADAGTGGSALLYLIDEVLQGTNSEERRVAARQIIRHLLASNAIGAVTTHDLDLHVDPLLDPSSTKVHFREQVGEVGDRVLTFDYVLRPGLATSRNALKLLRIVGLGDASDS